MVMHAGTCIDQGREGAMVVCMGGGGGGGGVRVG